MYRRSCSQRRGNSLGYGRGAAGRSAECSGGFNRKTWLDGVLVATLELLGREGAEPDRISVTE